MSSEFAIKVEGVGKNYRLYDKPHHRLLQMLRGEKKIYYRDFWAVKDVSFSVRKGETVGIIGRNGSGKSTLLQMICGTLTPTTGSIEVNGRVAALLELGAGFNPEFTGRENVYMAAALYGLTQEQINSRFGDITAFADIGNFIDQPVKTYSSGMMVRLAFAVIVNVDADILVIDEALAVGDAYFVQKCMRFLRGFTEKGTLIFVSHDSTTVVGLCSTAVLLQHGTVQYEGSPKEVTDYYLASLHEEFAQEGFVKTNQEENNRLKAMSSKEEFGTGAAKIGNVRLSDESGSSLLSVSGGENVRLSIECLPYQDVINPIVGFLVRDRLGQVVFGMNTLYSKQGQLGKLIKNHPLTVILSFSLPMLQTGDYSLGVALAEGTQLSHVQHHWIHDALILSFRPKVFISGIVGVDLEDVSVEMPLNL